MAGGVASALLNQSAAAKYSDHSACVKGKKTITLPVAYSVQPNILVFDETTKGGASLTEKVQTPSRYRVPGLQMYSIGWL